jgi:hypothetical protein
MMKLKYFIFFLVLLQGCADTEDKFDKPQCYSKEVCEKPWVQELLAETVDSPEEYVPVYYIQPGRHLEYGHTKFNILLSCDTGTVGVVLEGTKAHVDPEDYYYPNSPEELSYTPITQKVFGQVAVYTEDCYKQFVKETTLLGDYTFVRAKFFLQAEGTGDFKFEYWEYGKYIECSDVVYCPGGFDYANTTK